MQTEKYFQRVSTDFKHLTYKVIELEAMIHSDKIEFINAELLLDLMYRLDKVSDKINDFLGEVDERVIH